VVHRSGMAPVPPSPFTNSLSTFSQHWKKQVGEGKGSQVAVGVVRQKATERECPVLIQEHAGLRSATSTGFREGQDQRGGRSDKAGKFRASNLKMGARCLSITSTQSNAGWGRTQPRPELNSYPISTLPGCWPSEWQWCQGWQTSAEAHQYLPQPSRPRAKLTTAMCPWRGAISSNNAKKAVGNDALLT